MDTNDNQIKIIANEIEELERGGNGNIDQRREILVAWDLAAGFYVSALHHLFLRFFPDNVLLDISSGCQFNFSKSLTVS